MFSLFLGVNPYTPHFGQKLENSSNLFFIRKGLDMMFDGVLGKKDVFLDEINFLLRFVKNLHLSWVLTHDFGQKV